MHHHIVNEIIECSSGSTMCLRDELAYPSIFLVSTLSISKSL